MTDDEPDPVPCPRCGEPVTAVVQIVPTHHNAYPCGCGVREDLLE